MSAVQESVIKTLRNQREGLTMSELIQRVREDSTEPSVEIRAAVLPLITLNRVEFTPDRKLRLSGD